jgi:hypothetical protein
VKGKFERTQVADEDQFLKSLQLILSDIDREELNRIFQAWVWLIQEVSQDNGDYVG